LARTFRPKLDRKCLAVAGFPPPGFERGICPSVLVPRAAAMDGPERGIISYHAGRVNASGRATLPAAAGEAAR